MRIASFEKGLHNRLIGFFRKVRVKGSDAIDVEVDLMAWEYGGTGKTRRTQKVQDVRARKARDCDLAFDATVSNEL